MRPGIVYTRVSTKRQAEPDKSSLHRQDDACRQYAAANGIEIVHPTFCDAGLSGERGDNRPAFVALVEYCEANARPHGDGVILCEAVDRMGRFEYLDEFGHWTFRCRRAGWVWVFLDIEQDKDNPRIRDEIQRLIRDEIQRLIRMARREPEDE